MTMRLELAFIIAFAATIGCSAKPKETPTPVIPTSVGPTISAAAESRLEAADKADGVSDHVIGKCYVCGLGMDGSEKFAVKVKGYTAHLCSRACQKEFEESADKIVLETEIPSENKRE